MGLGRSVGGRLTQAVARRGPAGVQGLTGAGNIGTDVWASQANPAAVTDWGAVINALLAAGNWWLNFGKHDFPITTKIDLSNTTGVTFQGAGGAGYGTQFWTSTRTRLIWKGGAASGNCIDGGFAAMGFSLRDLGVYYDNAAYNGDLIAFENAACRAVGCAFGSLNGTQMTARSLLKLYQSVSSIVDWCNFSGAIDAIRGHEAGGTGVSDNNTIRNSVFENCSHSYICNPGRYWLIEGNTMEFGGFGGSAPLYGVTHDITTGSEAAGTFTFRDNRLWDMFSNTQIGLYEPIGASWTMLAVGNFFGVKAGFKLLGGANGTTRVTLLQNTWDQTFVAGDPSPIELGTQSRSTTIDKNRAQINAGGPVFIAGASNQRYLSSEGEYRTLWGYERFAPLTTNPAATLHGTPANVFGASAAGTDALMLVSFSTTGGGPSPTGMIVDVAFTTTQIPPNGGVGRALPLVSAYGDTDVIASASAAANAYIVAASTTGFTLGVKNAIPAGTTVQFVCRIGQT